MPGWLVTRERNQQVKTSDIEGYTGEGEPPCIVMTLRTVSDETTPPDLSLPVTLTGVREPNIITLERWLEPRSDNIQPDVSLPTKLYGYSKEFVCQVFYEKRSTNCWKVTLAFFQKDKADGVNRFYQNANIGEKIDIQCSHLALMMVKPIIPHCKVTDGWTVEQMCHKVNLKDVLSYSCGKPPVCEMTLKALTTENTLKLDPQVTVILSGLMKTNNVIIISRTVETSPGLHYDDAESRTHRIAMDWLDGVEPHLGESMESLECSSSDNSLDAPIMKLRFLNSLEIDSCAIEKDELFGRSCNF